ncbi:hypothetical protein N7505_002891 [Penicillium chrysogenum]|uniref:Uncharacterized protein n=1 Tax=Penicillium chrysogenum TaxID=5076 RepID=A0ABQ8WNN5_PENCH|nr:hypothetical protein N7505_002891 [Penicillium chrysogenum]
MSEHTVHVNADTAHSTAASTAAAAAAPVEAWRFVPHHEGIPPSAATDARVAEIVARAVQAQSSQDLNARGNVALGSRDHGQGRGNGQGGLLDPTRRAERIRRRGGSGYYAAREAHRTRRRRGSGYYPAREAELPINLPVVEMAAVLSTVFPITKPPARPPPIMDRSGGHNLRLVWAKCLVSTARKGMRFLQRAHLGLNFDDSVEMLRALT